MATWAEALLVWCEKCDSRKGQPCTYMVEQEIREQVYGPSSWDRVEGRWVRKLGPIIAVHKIGEPTTRPHNERFARADVLFHPRHPRARSINKPSEYRLAIARAENRFDRLEQRKVFRWLTQYGSILQVKEPELTTEEAVAALQDAIDRGVNPYESHA